MIDKARLFGIIFSGSIALVVSCVSLWALWEARSHKGTCDGLGEVSCGQAKYCHYKVQRGNNEWDGHWDTSYCRRSSGMDWLGGLGLVASVGCWFFFGYCWTWPENQALFDSRVESFMVILGGTVFIFTGYLGAMWWVAGSTTALVFFFILAVVYGSFGLGAVGVCLVDCCETEPPPDYNMSVQPEFSLSSSDESKV